MQGAPGGRRGKEVAVPPGGPARRLDPEAVKFCNEMNRISKRNLREAESMIRSDGVHKMTVPRCEGCRYLFYSEEQEDFTKIKYAVSKLARCRRFPPTRDAGGDCEWPQIYDPAKDWCGEWVRKIA